MSEKLITQGQYLAERNYQLRQEIAAVTAERDELRELADHTKAVIDERDKTFEELDKACKEVADLQQQRDGLRKSCGIIGSLGKDALSQLQDARAERDELDKELAEVNDTKLSLLFLLADIRRAAGDAEGRLMQPELVQKIAELRENNDALYKELLDAYTIRGELEMAGAEIDGLQAERDELREASGAFVERFRKIEWGWDGDCGASALVDDLEAAIDAAKGGER